MDQFYSESVDEGAPWNPIVIASDSDSDASIDGGVKLTVTHTPSSAYFSLHDGPKRDCLPESFPGGSRLEAWFKGVYGEADTDSCDSESSCYYDADSELNSLLDSDSESSDSIVNSALCERNPRSGPYTSDPVMGLYGSDSDPDRYIWESDLGSYTSDSDSNDWESNTGSAPSFARPVGYRAQ